MTLLLCCLGLIALALCVMALAGDPAPARPVVVADEVWPHREPSRSDLRSHASLQTTTALVAAALALDIAAGAAMLANTEGAQLAPPPAAPAAQPHSLSASASPPPWAAWLDADGFHFQPQARLPLSGGFAFETRDDIWRPQIDAEGWLV